MKIQLQTQKLRSAACAVVGLGIAVLATVCPCDAAWSAPGGGKIAFFSARDGNNEIYLMDADGTNQTRFTNLPGNDHSPDISPDGRKVVWASSREGGGADIYEKNIDGTNERRLTTNGADEIYPRYSPDGTKVAFSAFTGSDYDIIILDLKDLSQRRLTNSGLGDYRAAWSPDGSQIAYKYFYGNTYIPQITEINADGTNPTQIVGAGGNEDPSWSSTNQIAFYSTRDGSGEIYIMDPAGVTQTRLTSGGGTSREPGWNPSGTKIVFSSDRTVSNNYEIWTMNADGLSPVRLTNSAGMDGMPAWGLDPMPSGPETLSIGDDSVIEGDAGSVMAHFKVSLSAPASVPVSVNYSTANGTAGPADYVATSGTVVFAVGESEKTVDVPVLGDAATEGNEVFYVNLSNPLGASVTDGQGAGTIIDNESFPRISINSATFNEGDAGTSDATLTVLLSATSANQISVDYATLDGTAIAGVDYVATQGTLVFAPGETTKPVTVKLNGDIRFEQDEAFTVVLSNPVFAKIATPTASAQAFNPGTGHWYQLIKTAVPWNTAKTAAEALSLYGVAGHLVTVTSESEKNFLVNQFSANEFYLGGFQAPGSAEPGAGWQWITGEPFSYTNWNSGEPNNSFNGQNEDVIYAYASSPYQAGRWNDSVRANSMFYLVEYDTPASAGLAARPGTIVVANDDPGPLPPANVTIINPSAQPVNSLPSINGTALDNINGGGIDKVYLYLQRQSDNKYWDGGAWSSDTPVPLPAAVTGDGGLGASWQRSGGLPAPDGVDADHQLTEGSYLLTAHAVNVDGADGSTQRAFSVDLTVPAVEVIKPADGAILR